ncbi:MAG: GyrI-like domain-containing protein [Mycobacterium sp.]|nr:GyrI-like domain-containing protein [Mycobacterium sp.]
MSSINVDFKRELRDLHTARSTPGVVEVPQLRFLVIDGHGDPNTSTEYRDAVSALYAVAYAARFALKRDGALDYRVMPLEGLWWVPDMTRFSMEDKAAWHWTMMIMQPGEVSQQVYTDAKSTAAKKASASLERVRLDELDEGLAVQILHRGPYSAEGPTVAALHMFISEQGMQITGKHHEIYLSDPRRSAAANMRTIIRQPVRRGAESAGDAAD